MVYSATVVTLFLSSPSDVGVDRSTIIDAIEAWNQRNGPSRGLFFNVLTWENVVAPDIGASAQDVINAQIGDHYDIFLGVMWSRFGTPTKEGQSGTEEEFKRALERHSSGEDISVSFLFKTAPIPTAILDGLQYTKVQEFKAFVGKAGCMYRDYADDASLINAINLIIDRTANELAKAGLNFADDEPPVSPSSRPLVPKSKEPAYDADVGLFEVKDQIEDQGREFVAHLEEWSNRISQMGGNLSKSTDVLNTLSRFGAPDPTEVRKHVEGLSREIVIFTDWGERKVDEIEDCIDRYSNSFSLLVDLSKDFLESEESVNEAIASMEQLMTQIRETNRQLRGLSEAAASTPRISKNMNRATRRLSELTERMALKNEVFHENIMILKNELEKRLMA